MIENPICWLLQSSGGKEIVARERVPFAGFCKTVEGEVAERERAICWLLQSSGGKEVVVRERAICWLLQSSGETCRERERESHLLAAAKRGNSLPYLRIAIAGC